MIDYSRYYRAYAEMQATLDGDFAKGYLTGAISDGNKGNDVLSGNAYNRVIDMEWVEKIEETLPYIDKAIREDRKFIETYEEVDRVDKVKVVTKDAVRHLTQHTNLIQSVENGNVSPSRLLNTHREDSYATYENRFLYTLIFKIIAFVEARFRALQEAPNDSYNQMSMSREVKLNNQKFSFSITYSSESHDRDKIDKEEEIASLTDYERIERIRMMLTDFVNTKLIQALNGCIQVHSPINKTNCIKKDPNFSKCYELWSFIEAYRKTGYVVESNEYSGEMGPDVQKELYNVMAFQHFVMTISTNKALRDKLDAEYVAENKRRAEEANKPEEEIAKYLEDKIYEARREEMAIRLKEVRERDLVIAQLTTELDQEKEKVRQRDIKIAELKTILSIKEKELNETKEELRIAQQRVAELEAELEACKARIAELEETVERQAAQIAAQLATIAALEEKISVLENTISELKAEIEQQKAHIAQLEEIIAQHEATIAAQKAEIATLNANIAKLQAHINELTSENSELKTTVASQKETILTQKTEIADKTNLLDQSNKQINLLSSNLNDLQNRFDDVKYKYEDKKAQVDVLNSTLEKSKAESQQLTQQINIQLNTLAEKDSVIADLNKRNTELNTRVSAFDEVASAHKAELDDITDKYRRSEAECQSLHNTIKTHIATIADRDNIINSLKSAVDNSELLRNEEIAAINKQHLSEIEALKKKYESVIAVLEKEKIAAFAFSDKKKYAARLKAEKKAIINDYNKRLAKAQKKARAYVRKAKVLVDDRPDALLKLPETSDYE